MSVITPPERICQVVAFVRLIQVPAYTQVFQVPNVE